MHAWRRRLILQGKVRLARGTLEPEAEAKSCNMSSQKRLAPSTDVPLRNAAKRVRVSHPGVRTARAPSTYPSAYNLDNLAARLTLGRSEQRLLQLVHTRMLQAEPRVCDGTLDALRLQRGLFATHAEHGQVLVVDTFTRRGLSYADICPLLPCGSSDEAGTFKLGHLLTSLQSELQDPKLNFEVVPHSAISSTIKFRRRDCEGVAVQVDVGNVLSATRSVSAAVPNARQASLTLAPLTMAEARPIIPSEARQHSEQTGHVTRARADKRKLMFVLDLPLPVPIDASPHRCVQCQHHVAGARSYFQVSLADIQVFWPEVSQHEAFRQSPVLATPLFLMHLLQLFYEECNVRACRRRLAELFACNYTALLVRDALQASEASRGDHSWVFRSLPPPASLSSMLVVGLWHFVKNRVHNVRRRQLIYNSKGIRGDGNYKMAKRIVLRVWPRRTRPFTVILAWCGLDGSLLQPMKAYARECWPLIARDLEAMLRDIQLFGLSAGLPLMDTLPVFHATDSYQKHRFKIKKSYVRIWDVARVHVLAPTPRADAAGMAVLPPGASVVNHMLHVTGEPEHDVITARRLVSPSANDCKDFVVDHADLIHRLSARLYTGTDADRARPGIHESLELSGEAVQLLKEGIAFSSAAFSASCGRGPAACSLKAFLKHPGARWSPVWLREFGAVPPRGVLARLARRAGCELSEVHRVWNYQTEGDFVEEVRRTADWYKKPRKQRRWHLGIDRTESGTSQYVRGLPVVWNAKIAGHYRKLLSRIRLDGLMSWRYIALATHLAGLPTQSGTVPVERMWAGTQAFLPESARQISERWFQFLADVAYIRFNHRHFNHHSLPSWTYGDTLLAERADTLFDVVRSLQNDDDGSVAHILAEVLKREAPRASQALTAPGEADAEGKGTNAAHPRSVGTEGGSGADANGKGVSPPGPSHIGTGGESGSDAEGKSLALCWSSPAVLQSIRACEDLIPKGTEGVLLAPGFRAIFTGSTHLRALRLSFEHWLEAARQELLTRVPHLSAALMHGSTFHAAFEQLLISVQEDLILQRTWHCCVRSLDPIWADALCRGEKWFEFQRYRSRALNQLEWCSSGGIILFGAAKNMYVSGLALLRGVVKGCTADDVPFALGLVPQHLRVNLGDYLAPAITFDYAAVQLVFDWSELRITWQAAARELGAVLPGHRAGFPSLKVERGDEAWLDRVYGASSRLGAVIRVRPHSLDLLGT